MTASAIHEEETAFDPSKAVTWLTSQGYVQFNIAKKNVFMHRYRWELANGKLPAGAKLRCLDGNKENTSPSNWEPIVAKGRIRGTFVLLKIGGRDVPKHRHIWTLANGPIPIGMVLRCLSDDRLNSEPSNWEMIPRPVLTRANGIMGANKLHAECKETAFAVAKVKHRIEALKQLRASTPAAADTDT